MSEQLPIRQREVLYFAGFDPQGARHYHRLYREQARLSQDGAPPWLQVGPSRRNAEEDGNAAWRLTANTASGTVSTSYRVMAWDDIVRRHWTRSRWRMARDSLSATLFHLRHGAVRRALHSAWPPVLAALAPSLLMLLGAVSLVALLGVAAAALRRDGGAAWPVLVVVLLTIGGMGALAHRLSSRLAMGWLTRSFAFNMRLGQGRDPDFRARARAHASALVEAAQRLRGAHDAELLIVGHSSGALIAVATLAEALRLDPDLAGRGLRVSLLTLGQCMPMLGCLPQASDFRDDVSRVAHGIGHDWLDFSAPPDGCCFALSDPLRACSIPARGRQVGPRLLSPRFSDMFDDAAYAALKRDKLRMHFQYLMAAPRAVDYDYFAITAGDQTLAQRFAQVPAVVDYDRFRLFKSAPPPWPEHHR